MKINVIAAVFLAVRHALGAAGVTRTFSLDIVNALLAPDGFKRSTVVANGLFPGPLLMANKGDTMQVIVNNRLTDPTMRRSTSINFDGIFFTTANAFNEGTPFVTTCPIAPNASYTHTLPLGTQAGTFWYHSQLSAQHADGLRGPLIIYDPEDPMKSLYDVDDGTTMNHVTIGDWWHDPSVSILAEYLETGISPTPDSGTFNGVGRFPGGPATPFFVQNVQQGKRYRFRIINISAFSLFSLSVDQHNITIIEADGVEVRPIIVNEIDILAGQRYSAVLLANQPVGNYWINTPYFAGCVSNESMTLARGILRYAGAQQINPAGPMTLGPENPNLLVEANLQVPLPDVNLTLSIAFVNEILRWTVNNSSYAPPQIPTLLKVLEGADVAADFNTTENTLLFPVNAVVQIEFLPFGDGAVHPFHLHGNNFWLIKSDSSDVVNTINPVLRDVAGVGQNGTIIRFTTNNPGPWFFHSHIVWHKEAGLAIVLLEGADQTRTGVRPTSAWLNLCPLYDALPPDLQ
ncbi:Cupredoxin [Infundibulicybe gibba]|nr:Cupredoxin [Infundibulicybe gibba]